MKVPVPLGPPVTTRVSGVPAGTGSPVTVQVAEGEMGILPVEPALVIEQTPPMVVPRLQVPAVFALPVALAAEINAGIAV